MSNKLTALWVLVIVSMVAVIAAIGSNCIAKEQFRLDAEKSCRYLYLAGNIEPQYVENVVQVCVQNQMEKYEPYMNYNERNQRVEQMFRDGVIDADTFRKHAQ